MIAKSEVLSPDRRGLGGSSEDEDEKVRQKQSKQNSCLRCSEIAIRVQTIHELMEEVYHSLLAPFVDKMLYFRVKVQKPAQISQAAAKSACVPSRRRPQTGTEREGGVFTAVLCQCCSSNRKTFRLTSTIS